MPASVEAKETAPKKALKKAAVPKASAPAVETTSTPAPTPAAASAKPAAAKKAAAPKKAAAKKAAAPIKLSTSQDELLKKIHGTAETGYPAAKKAEQKSIDSLLGKKLIKKGAKNKATGSVHYHISTAGKKHLS